ncbi:hemolysin secretion protein D, plasmid [Carpediemonas membranifera]|uniref:Hemolysin secretion protein D, plasmid n=1 Tax=Carpediemonas membranifera TaxID=201153 RepID=A0A8J6AZ76_9EUKA|nr:hemolysin secretion protein D, plasmid [Carpediemonas membranifera]|eukprot:KAG9395010.1 hemolysin secretion protein D, plasmid [Carpediemonas membranifera]
MADMHVGETGRVVSTTPEDRPRSIRFSESSSPDKLNTDPGSLSVSLLMPVTVSESQVTDADIRRFTAHLLRSKPADIQFFALLPVDGLASCPPGASLGVCSETNVITSSSVQALIARNKSLDQSLKATVNCIFEMQQARSTESSRSFDVVREAQDAERESFRRLTEEQARVHALELEVMRLRAQLDQSEQLRKQGQAELEALRVQFRQVVDEVRTATSRQGVRPGL